MTELLSKEEEVNQKLTEDLKKVSFEKERLLAKVNELEKQNELLKNTSKEMNRKWQQDREDYSSINSICEYLKKDLERQLEILKTERDARVKAEIELAKLQGKHQS